MAKADNFNSDIHSYSYLSHYTKKKITSSSLMDIFRKEKWPLDGVWNYTVDAYNSALRAHWIERQNSKGPKDFSFEGNGEIKVPSCINSIKGLEYFEGSIIYTRKLKLDDKMKGHKRYFIHAEGILARAFLFFNGEYLGYHEGGSTPFTVEITKLLKDENEIAIIVNTERYNEAIPSANFDWFNYGGIYRSIYLMASDEKAYVKSTSISYKEGFLSVKVDFVGTNRKEIVLKTKNKEIIIPPSGAITLPFNDVHLWSLEDPYLYTFTLKVGFEELTYHVGLREIEVVQDKILLNKKEIFLKGVCVHEEYGKKGKCASKKDILSVIKDAKELGCNYLRLTHYPHSREFASLADREGILLWEEIPVYWAIEFKNKSTYQNAENQLKELIYRDRSRASVIIWSVGNENEDSDERLAFMSSLAKTAKEIDNTRLTSAACIVNPKKVKIDDRLASKLDIIGVNEYYGWFDEDVNKLTLLFENSKVTKPLIISEFGSGALYGFKGEDGLLFSEVNQDIFYKHQIEQIEKIDAIKGLSPWVLYDFRSPRRMNKYQTGYNRKGLIDSDHKSKKLAFYRLSEFYRRKR